GIACKDRCRSVYENQVYLAKILDLPSKSIDVFPKVGDPLSHQKIALIDLRIVLRLHAKQSHAHVGGIFGGNINHASVRDLVRAELLARCARGNERGDMEGYRGLAALV